MIHLNQDESTFPKRKSRARISVYAVIAVAVISTLIGGSPIHAYAAGGVVLVGAGDISTCNNDNDSKTAKLLDSIPGTIFTTGDNVYSNGKLKEFMDCYHPTWGKHKNRTMPAPGNHEYNSTGAAGYYRYFGVRSYYAYNRGSWRIYALNSEINTTATGRQAAWLKKDLAANPRKCVLAYWHKPRWSSGSTHGSDSTMQALWSILVDAKAELVVSGHEHNYERFAPMNKNGQLDRNGVRQIVVGTGGVGHYGFKSSLSASRVRNSNTYGVLKLTLHPDRYIWKFVPIAGQSFTDGGVTRCH